MSWLHLWTAVFVVSVASFALISAIVTVRGLAEVRELFRGFAEEEPPER